MQTADDASPFCECENRTGSRSWANPGSSKAGTVYLWEVFRNGCPRATNALSQRSRRVRLDPVDDADSWRWSVCSAPSVVGPCGSSPLLTKPRHREARHLPRTLAGIGPHPARIHRGIAEWSESGAPWSILRVQFRLALGRASRSVLVRPPRENSGPCAVSRDPYGRPEVCP